MKFSVGGEGNTEGNEGEGSQVSGVMGPGGTFDIRKCWVQFWLSDLLTEEPAWGQHDSGTQCLHLRSGAYLSLLHGGCEDDIR